MRCVVVTGTAAGGAVCKVVVQQQPRGKLLIEVSGPNGEWFGAENGHIVQGHIVGGAGGDVFIAFRAKSLEAAWKPGNAPGDAAAVATQNACQSRIRSHGELACGTEHIRPKSGSGGDLIGLNRSEEHTS